MRRDFQALWNTQFFEDVKLRVEDSPEPRRRQNHCLRGKRTPIIRRIRYEGIHSISESDILDRFKERKVGLSVESQFDPTRIKKAEVVLRELLGEHGRQFAKVTPQYERIASSNAVILVFKIEEGPKVKSARSIHRQSCVQRPQIDSRHAPRSPVCHSIVPHGNSGAVQDL